MGFTETVFLFAFLPLSILLYVLADKLFHNDKVNNLLLVLFSIVFYYWAHKESLFIFVVIILFTYMAGNTVNTDTVGKNKRLQFFLVIILGVLAYYKYITFIGSLLDDLTARPIISVGELIVPIGISFTVFESISYVIDIYRGDAQAGTLLECFTFMSLFPKLVSGPIVLWKDFHHQLIGRRTSLEKIAYGIDRIIIGYAKKVILADSFGQQIMLINSEISNGGVDTPTMWIRALLYFFQLYIDFSGYSDIAIGLCNIFGFSIKENFRFPYLSKSITEFWRRWHISLGTWFREYVYIPLGGNQKGNVYIHLIIVFILTGIWHGAGWPFLLWGAAHAVLVAFERAISDKTWYKKIPSTLKWMLTVVTIYLTWIIFMSNDIAEARATYTGMVAMSSMPVNFTWQYYLSTRMIVFLIISVIGIGIGVDKINERLRKQVEKPVWRVIVRIALIALFVVDIMFIVNSTYSPFLYFQF